MLVWESTRWIREDFSRYDAYREIRMVPFHRLIYISLFENLMVDKIQKSRRSKVKNAHATVDF